MKILKNIIIFALAFILIMPSFALTAEEEALAEEALAEIVLTEDEYLKSTDIPYISRLIDDTMEKQEIMSEKAAFLLADININKNKKQKEVRITVLITVLITIIPSPTLLAAPAAVAAGITTLVEKSRIDLLEKRHKRYEELEKEYVSAGRAARIEKRFIKSLTYAFADNPAAYISMLAEDKELFTMMMKENPRVLRILKNYNTVVAANPEDFSDEAVKKLSSANMPRYLARLVEYLDTKKELADKLRDKTKKEIKKELNHLWNDEFIKRSKASDVALKELRKENK